MRSTLRISGETEQILTGALYLIGETGIPFISVGSCSVLLRGLFSNSLTIY